MNNDKGTQTTPRSSAKVVGSDRPTVLSASSLTSDRVVNAADEDCGKLHELMIDLETGRVAYAVLSFGGFLGLGDKLFAIPWEALRIDTDRKVLILDVNKERLKNAPGFDKERWPDFNSRTWGAEIHDYYGYRPYW